jgi:23S rRNA (pseudouridine1915-N3)-methyltransferase
MTNPYSPARGDTHTASPGVRRDLLLRPSVVKDENPFYAHWFAQFSDFLNRNFCATVLSMAVRLIVVGGLSQSFLKAAEDEYLKRLRPYLKVGVLELPNAKDADPRECMKREGDAILATIKPREQVIALDETGKTVTSAGFAKLTERWLVSGDVAFVIGGAFGLGSAVKSKAIEVLSLSALTFTYQFARVLLVEQLYRASCINRGVDYSK